MALNYDRPASAVFMADLTGFTRFTNTVFGMEKSIIHGVMVAMDEFRKQYILSLKDYGIGPAYPANRMGDGYLIFLYRQHNLAKRLIHLAWAFQEGVFTLQKKWKDLLGEEIPLPGIKMSAQFHPQIIELVLEPKYRGKSTFDPKDFISPDINLVARMLGGFDNEAPYTIILPPFDCQSLSSYDLTIQEWLLTEEVLHSKFKGFSPEDVSQRIGSDKLWKVTIGKNPFL